MFVGSQSSSSWLSKEPGNTSATWKYPACRVHHMIYWFILCSCHMDGCEINLWLFCFLSVSRGDVVQVAGLGGYRVNATGHTCKTIFCLIISQLMLESDFGFCDCFILTFMFLFNTEWRTSFFLFVNFGVDILCAKFLV